jgi:hypothetical protein
VTERTLRAVLIAVAAYHVLIGALAMIDPGTFFDEIGRYGVENSHYVGDNGSFALAYGIALLLALARPRWWAPLLYLGALWYGLHALNHVFDIDEARSDARGIADTVLLALGAVAAVALARVAERLSGETGR